MPAVEHESAGERSMSEINLRENHKWIRNLIMIADRIVFHRQCERCGRDLAMSVDDGEWRAVHVGALDFDFLDDQTTRRWIEGDCPGFEIPEEANHLRLMQKTQSFR